MTPVAAVWWPPAPTPQHLRAPSRPMRAALELFVFGGGPSELEQMGSADPPLAVRCLYGGRKHLFRRLGREPALLGVLRSAAPACLAAVHRSVLVRAAVCRQVAQGASHRSRDMT